MSETEALMRIFVALGLGSFIGIERQMRGQFAGLKTHALVSLGSALFVVISEIVSYETGLNADPLRMASQIIVGIGFIGGGAILHKSDSLVKGVSTAAGLWVAAGVGVAIGFGLYTIGMVVTGILVFLFAIVGPLEDRLT